ncbi:MAG TPA: hypothetical protein PK706_26425 [Xanthobacteraceae bacterium]|nr:hypothetical protein [Xanthobacteraceae bacterium]
MPVEEGDGLAARWRAQSLGWWEDPLCRVWRAPDEPIQQPFGDPTSFETLAVAFEPPEAGWIDFVLASYKQVALIRISYLYSSGAEIVAWLEEVARGGFPRVAISEEGSFGELHLFPGDRFPQCHLAAAAPRPCQALRDPSIHCGRKAEARCGDAAQGLGAGDLSGVARLP